MDANVVRPESPDRWYHGLLALFFPVLIAKVLFGAFGAYEIDDRWLSRVSLLRSVALGVVLLGAMIQFDPSSLWRYPEATVNSSSNTVLIAIAVVLVTLLVTAALVRSPWRAKAWRAMLWPTARIAGLLGFAFGGQALGWWTLGTEAPPAGGSSRDVTVNSFVWSLVVLVLVVILVIFLCGALYYVGRDLFAIGDAHPRLLPVASIALALVMLCFDVAASFGHAAPFLLDVESPALPSDLAAAITWVATTSAIGLAVWEFRLAGAHGYRLRDGAWR